MLSLYWSFIDSGVVWKRMQHFIMKTFINYLMNLYLIIDVPCARGILNILKFLTYTYYFSKQEVVDFIKTFKFKFKTGPDGISTISF